MGQSGLTPQLTHEGGELGVVADAVQKSVEEDGLAVGAELSPCVRVVKSNGSFQSMSEAKSCWKILDGAVVGGVDGSDGVEGDVGVVGDGEASEAFGVAEFAATMCWRSSATVFVPAISQGWVRSSGWVVRSCRQPWRSFRSRRGFLRR